jgi:hypothetical protein
MAGLRTRKGRNRQAPILINIGLDYGTSFSKLCVRHSGREYSEICRFGRKLPDEALLPSAVLIDANGKLSAPNPGSQVGGPQSARYLKMGLADEEFARIPNLRILKKYDRQAVIRALSSWYIAHTLKMARTWTLANWTNRIGDREVDWSCNMGVPVAYYDSPILKVFSETLRVAWTWFDQNRKLVSIEDTINEYEATLNNLNPADLKCDPYPEIAAAIQSFAVGRSAREAVYIYFDIGGGTVDGVAFRLSRPDGEAKVDFFSADVQPYGVAAFAEAFQREAMRSDNGETFRDLIKGLLSENPNDLAHRYSGFVSSLQTLVSSVIVTAQRKDGRDWRSISVDGRTWPHNYVSLPEDQIMKLPVFIGGGAYNSDFYRTSISSTYGNRQHQNYGIPPYELRVPPKPHDLELGDMDPDLYHRFLVAHGLSIPFGEGPDIRLPSQTEAPQRRRKVIGPGYSYEDMKSMFD